MISIQGVTVPRKESRFDIVKTILERATDRLKEGDVLVVSSKFVAIAEGRVVRLDSVNPGPEAKALATEHQMDARLCELVLKEADEVIGGIPGFLLSLTDGLLAPNAGIDRSNIGQGKVVLYPKKPEESARAIRTGIKRALGLSVGIVLCDSRLSPTRRGTVGVALAASGFEGVVDMRGRKDLFGKELRVTSQALADDVCSAAEIAMGESDEGCPIVIVRGLKKHVSSNSSYPTSRFSIGIQDCIYMGSVGLVGKARLRDGLRHGTSAPRR